MDQDLIDFIRENGVSEVLTSEPVYGSSRPLTVKYALESYIVTETITYKFPAWHDGWSAVSGREYVLETDPQFSSIEL